MHTHQSYLCPNEPHGQGGGGGGAGDAREAEMRGAVVDAGGQDGDVRPGELADAWVFGVLVLVLVLVGWLVRGGG